MSKITQYGLSGIIVVFAIGSYLNFLVERDTKMMNYFDSTIQRVEHEWNYTTTDYAFQQF